MLVNVLQPTLFCMNAPMRGVHQNKSLTKHCINGCSVLVFGLLRITDQMMCKLMACVTLNIYFLYSLIPAISNIPTIKCLVPHCLLVQEYPGCHPQWMSSLVMVSMA